MILERQLLLNKKPTASGRVYFSSHLKHIRKSLETLVESQKNFGILHNENPNFFSISDAPFTFENPVIEDGSLLVDIKLLETPNGKLLGDMIRGGNSMSFTVVLNGTIATSQDKDGFILQFPIINEVVGLMSLPKKHSSIIE